MLVVSVSDKKEYRKKCSLQYCRGDEIFVDDDIMDFFDLEQYIYPSLFEESTPVVYAKFMIEDNHKDLSIDFVKKLVASPTTFFFEEISLLKDTIKILEKSGAIVHLDKEKSEIKQKDNLFAVASAIVSENKKTSWLNYQKAIKEYNIEAILGIIYWKTRDLMLKNSKNNFYRNFYKDLLSAHANSWMKGIPLELSIEKVILK